MSLTGRQRDRVVLLASVGKTTGEIIEIIGGGVSESQVAYIKRAMPLKSAVVSISTVVSSFWVPRRGMAVMVKAMLANGKEVTVGISKGYASRRDAETDADRIEKLVSKELVGKEIEYSIRRAPRDTWAAEQGKLYCTAKFRYLPERLKKEFRGI